MARLDETTKEALRTLTVAVLMDLRSAYLANGASPLKHWDQLLDRMRAATRTTASVEEWHTAVSRGLQLGCPSNGASSSLDLLVRAVGTRRGDWLDLVEREHGYLLAACRLEADRRREARDARDGLADADTITMEGN